MPQMINVARRRAQLLLPGAPAFRVASALLLASVLLLAAGAGFATPGTRGQAHPNIVLIVVDAMRPDHLGCFGYERPTSPNIDGLAAGGIVFETAITQASYTRASFPSLLTSLYPFQHGVTNWESALPETLVTLPEALGASGYHSVAVVHGTVLAKRFGILRGFDEELSMLPGRRGAEKLSAAAIDAIADAPEPFFLMLHLFDAHKPYNAGKEYVTAVRGASKAEPFRWKAKDYIGISETPEPGQIEGEILLYDASIRYADYGIGKVLEHLEASGISDRTLVVITADHGESFWEHGLPMHSTNVYDEVARVPLIFFYPDGFTTPARIWEQVRLIDLFPTFVDIAGGTLPGQCEGASLLGMIEGEGRETRPGMFLPPDMALTECTTPRALAMRCLRTAEYKLLVESVTASAELYDLRGDPAETRNISGSGIALEDSLMKQMGEIPGVPLRGWRIGFTGGHDSVTFECEVELPYGGRITTLELLTGKDSGSLAIGADSTTCAFTCRVGGLDLLLLDTKPATVPIRFSLSDPGKVLKTVLVGSSDSRQSAEAFMVDTESGLGTPGSFDEHRWSGTPGAYVWWLPGQRLARPGPTEALTPEEVERLKSLGYIN